MHINISLYSVYNFALICENARNILEYLKAVLYMSKNRKDMHNFIT